MKGGIYLRISPQQIKQSNISLIQSLDELTTSPLLAILKDDEALNYYNMKIYEKLLKMHQYEISYNERENRWYTYLPDSSKKNGRKQIKKRKKEDLEAAIVSYYKDKLHQEDENKTTLADVYPRYMLYRRDISPASSKTIYEESLVWKNYYQQSNLVNLRLIDIKPITILRFFQELTKDRKYTYKHISNIRTLLNNILSYAVEEEYIETNPISSVNFKKLTYKPVESQSKNVFSKEDTIKLLTYLSERPVDEYVLAIQLSFYLFIRVGETKALTWDSVDFDKKTIQLHKQATLTREMNDDMSFSERKVLVLNEMKGKRTTGYRTEYLRPEAIELLKKARELNPDGKFIFMPNGRLMTTDTFNRRLKKYCTDCGIKYHSSHKIRFYACSSAYNGDNIAQLSRSMGHSQVSTTMKYLRDVIQDNTDTSLYDNLGIPKTS